ncbi:MAG: hypothetical protein HGA85_08865, partial [Nanoarchaeota archaeon]|nr:hypothetical protein [Nanoarchaeota archaeon]
SLGKRVTVTAHVKSVRQTSGPTVFHLSDDTGEIRAIGFSAAGERAFKEVMPGMKVQAECIVKERQGAVELELVSCIALKEEWQGFSIESESLQRLKPNLLAAAALLKESAGKRQIIIRHHDDVDGYVSGYAIERALRTVSDDKWLTVRSSSRTPFYDYIDVMRDLNTCQTSRSKARPLIVLCDLGSNDQSIKAISRVPADFLIIDHHRYDEENKAKSVVFVNPHAEGLGSELSAGALCVEIALMISPGLNLRHLPGVCQVADKCNGKDTEKYLANAGMSLKFAEDLAMVLDHDLYHLKFQESLELLDSLFDRNTAEAQVANLLPRLQEEIARATLAAKRYQVVKEHNGFAIVTIEKSKVVNYDYVGGKLPRILSSLHTGPRMIMVYDEGAISFRVDGVAFSLPKLVSYLKEKLPYAMIAGGGHDYAGTLKYNLASEPEVSKEIALYLSKTTVL